MLSVMYTQVYHSVFYCQYSNRPLIIENERFLLYKKAMGNDIKKQLKNLPKDAGCYLFKDEKEKIIYIGKAVNLKNRVSQYFRKSEKQSLKTQKLIENIFSVDFIKCDSDIDALIEEARLIKKYNPKYNILLRDDKNYFFVGITKEEFPRIFITHQPSSLVKCQMSNVKYNFFGPFTDGFALKQTLKILRNIFPYRHCVKMPKKPCLQYHMGRCLAPCKFEKGLTLRRSEVTGKVGPFESSSGEPSDFWRSGRQIQINIKEIKSILSGKKQTVLKKLEKDMKDSAEKENFERANELKKKIESLKKIFAHKNYLENFKRIKRQTNWEEIEKYIQNILGIKDRISRVECYDISNISGKNAVGSMVVFKDGIPDKKEYRKFNIKFSGDEPNDPKMMQEILERRMKHPEWQAPDLIILDGGITQLNAVRKAVGEKYPILSIAKRNEEIYTKNSPLPLPAADMPSEVKYFFQQIRDEAHRFAITFHRQKRSKAFLGDSISK